MEHDAKAPRVVQDAQYEEAHAQAKQLMNTAIDRRGRTWKRDDHYDRPVMRARDDAWAYTPAHRDLLARAHEDSREGRVRSLTEEDLAQLAD